MCADEPDLRVLETIQDRLLWLATNMIDYANHRRPGRGELKVGGHQASCASMVTLMTALYLHHLRADDFVAVKPHGGPVLHALNYLMGTLDRDHLLGLREFGGLQAYPSRTKDPDRVDFSTGSVGLGPAATLFSAATRNYVDAHFGAREASRFFAVLGDAELDEGNVWEAVHDPGTTDLGAVTWLIDFNRQSLDRVVPDVRISPWHGAFASHGWQVIQIKYGTRLTRFAADNDADDLLAWIDEMPNERYQSLFGRGPAAIRERFLDGAPRRVRSLLDDLDDQTVARLVTDLGGHDLTSVLSALDEIDPERPSAVFAYTHKGWGLPIQGNARNHAAVLSPEQVIALRDRLGLTEQTQWDRFPPDSPAGQLLARRAAALHRQPPPVGARPSVPVATFPRASHPVSTQETFGRILLDLGRHEGTRPFLVTSSPDVATSTNLGGWINRAGVFAPHERPTWSDDPSLKWLESPRGQHIELGISEMNLFLLLGQLGLSEHFSGQCLLPVGTLYDPFVCRGLDALIYALYSGSRFVFAGTPSGISLAPEGGAHQSTITPSIGVELPGLDYHEPAYAQALDWLLCDALGRIARGDHGSCAAYFRLSTRPLPQSPFEEARARTGDAELRAQVLRGAYRLSCLPAGEAAPRVTIASCGVVVDEVLKAAAELNAEGIGVTVVDVPSPGRLYRSWRERTRDSVRTASRRPQPEGLGVFPAGVPLVTVQDGASHHLAWLGGALGVPAVCLGTDSFGQSGTVADLYRAFHLDAGAIVNAALDVAGC